MLKKLRIRFIAITMAIILLMLCVIFATVIRFTRQNLERESLSMIQSVAADPLQLNWPGISTSRLPYFTVRFSLLGGIRVIGESYYDLSDQSFVEELVNTAVNGEENPGRIPEYSLRYYRTVYGDAGYIIFADVSSETATMRSLIRNCLIIGLCSMGVFFVISLFLSKWSVRPAEKAWEQQRQFVSDASHELKTPLTVILTNAEMLQSPEYGDEEKKRFSDSILSMARQMKGLVEDLLALARAENGSMKSRFVPLDLSALTEEAVMTFEPVFFERGLTLDSRIEPGLRCMGSPDHLRQVEEILLDNAQKYASPGTVNVQLEKHGRNHCLLQVSTPGEELSEEERESIFRRFYRTDKARSTDGSYGLGLAIARSILEEHGGKIWCESGEGRNTFLVQLPAL